MLLHHAFRVPPAIAIRAVEDLSKVDYQVANKVTDVAAHVVRWSYAHDVPWCASTMMHTLQTFDNIGSLLIALVIWIVDHV